MPAPQSIVSLAKAVDIKELPSNYITRDSLLVQELAKTRALVEKARKKIAAKGAGKKATGPRKYRARDAAEEAKQPDAHEFVLNHFRRRR